MSKSLGLGVRSVFHTAELHMKPDPNAICHTRSPARMPMWRRAYSSSYQMLLLEVLPYRARVARDGSMSRLVSCATNNPCHCHGNQGPTRAQRTSNTTHSQVLLDGIKDSASAGVDTAHIKGLAEDGYVTARREQQSTPGRLSAPAEHTKAPQGLRCVRLADVEPWLGPRLSTVLGRQWSPSVLWQVAHSTHGSAHNGCTEAQQPRGLQRSAQRWGMHSSAHSRASSCETASTNQHTNKHTTTKWRAS